GGQTRSCGSVALAVCELATPVGKLLAQVAVPGRPARPCLLEVALGLLDLLDGQLSGPIFDPLQTSSRFFTPLACRGALLVLLSALGQDRLEQKHRAVRELLSDDP